jgi:signal transduction histidine kinase
VTGELGHLSPTLAATLYRLAQESITNATRDARNGRRIDVHVAGEADRITGRLRRE